MQTHGLCRRVCCKSVSVEACHSFCFPFLPCLPVPVVFPDPVVFACSNSVCLFLPSLPVLVMFSWSSCVGAFVSIVVELILYCCCVFYSIPCFNPSPINVRHFVTLFCKPEFMITFILTKQLSFLPHVWEKNWLHDVQPLVSSTNAITEHLFALIKLHKYYLTCSKVSVKYVSMCLKDICV